MVKFHRAKINPKRILSAFILEETYRLCRKKLDLSKRFTMRLVFTFIFACILSSLSFSQLEGGFSPEVFLGYKIGTQFTPQHKVTSYFQALEKAFPKQVKVTKYGQTYEGRDLLLVYIGTEKNIAALNEIQKKHREHDENENLAIVWLSYNVHGNESAGTEAAMQTAYDLLTVKSDYLNNTLIIMDPCLNPDGRDRYINYYNQYHTQKADANLWTKEHNEPWPGGRPNHYLFDLNRDWAWMSQIESMYRVQVYNKWMPHVHVDFHEQGINEPYYFPPAAEPYHEVITNWQRNFQKEIGKNHASYFDKNGWLYFSKEVFDLLYPSYGDTYPTYNGAIGMTYEQGGSGRGGLCVITQTGDTLKLSDRVLHHVTTGLSTVETVTKRADKLIAEYKDFCKKKNYKYKSFVVSGNEAKIQSLTTLLDKSEIKYEAISSGTVIKGLHYKTGKVESLKGIGTELLISTDQEKGTLVNVLFEPITKLSDSLTYDITAWTLPFAYGLDAYASETKILGANWQKKVVQNIEDKTCYAYVCRWQTMNDARFLAALQSRDVRVYFSEKAFEMDGNKFDAGSLLIMRGENKLPDFDKIVLDEANKSGVHLLSVKSGFVDKGSDFGAYSVKYIPKVRAGLLMGESTSSLNVGEIWHFFEQQLHYELHLIDEADFASVLSNLDVLIVPEGGYDLASNTELKEWISKGNKLIVMGNALTSFVGNPDFGLQADTSNSSGKPQTEINYSDAEREQISNTITGAIYACEVDASNPLAFGYTDYFTLRMSADHYSLNGNMAMKTAKNAAPLNGFVGSNVKKAQAETLTAGVQNLGAGTVVYLVDNPLFRAFWENGKLMMCNALFFVGR